MRDPTMQMIELHLKAATTWLTVKDIHTLLAQQNCKHISVSGVRRALSRLKKHGRAVSEKVYGDRHQAKKWAKPDTVPVTNATNTNGLALVPATTDDQELKMQIRDAVETVLIDWTDANKNFSAHDVTVEIRNRINNGLLKVDAAPSVADPLGQGVTKNIKHDMVRDVVHELMQTNFHSYDRKHNGKYWEYSPTPAAPPSTNDPGTDGGSYDGSSTL